MTAHKRSDPISQWAAALRDRAGWHAARGPLSPLLANILLHELDRELEQRGHRFARYADDMIIFVKSQRAAQQVMRSVTRYLEHDLKLTVNLAKSKVAPMSECSFLGNPAWRQQQELLAHGTNPGAAAGTVQRVVESARAGQREGLVAPGPGLHHLREHFVERADWFNRPLRTRMVGGVGRRARNPQLPN
jgi:hypothetical protein